MTKFILQTVAVAVLCVLQIAYALPQSDGRIEFVTGSPVSSAIEFVPNDGMIIGEKGPTLAIYSSVTAELIQYADTTYTPLDISLLISQSGSYVLTCYAGGYAEILSFPDLNIQSAVPQGCLKVDTFDDYSFAAAVAPNGIDSYRPAIYSAQDVEQPILRSISILNIKPAACQQAYFALEGLKILTLFSTTTQFFFNDVLNGAISALGCYQSTFYVISGNVVEFYNRASNERGSLFTLPSACNNVTDARMIVDDTAIYVVQTNGAVCLAQNPGTANQVIGSYTIGGDCSMVQGAKLHPQGIVVNCLSKSFMIPRWKLASSLTVQPRIFANGIVEYHLYRDTPGGAIASDGTSLYVTSSPNSHLARFNVTSGALQNQYMNTQYYPTQIAFVQTSNQLFSCNADGTSTLFDATTLVFYQVTDPGCLMVTSSTSGDLIATIADGNVMFRPVLYSFGDYQNYWPQEDGVATNLVHPAVCSDYLALYSQGGTKATGIDNSGFIVGRLTVTTIIALACQGTSGYVLSGNSVKCFDTGTYTLQYTYQVLSPCSGSLLNSRLFATSTAWFIVTTTGIVCYNDRLLTSTSQTGSFATGCTSVTNAAIDGRGIYVNCNEVSRFAPFSLITYRTTTTSTTTASVTRSTTIATALVTTTTTTKVATSTVAVTSTVSTTILATSTQSTVTNSGTTSMMQTTAASTSSQSSTVSGSSSVTVLSLTSSSSQQFSSTAALLSTSSTGAQASISPMSTASPFTSRATTSIVSSTSSQVSSSQTTLSSSQQLSSSATIASLSSSSYISSAIAFTSFSAQQSRSAMISGSVYSNSVASTISTAPFNLISTSSSQSSLSFLAQSPTGSSYMQTSLPTVVTSVVSTYRGSSSLSLSLTIASSAFASSQIVPSSTLPIMSMENNGVDTVNVASVNATLTVQSATITRESAQDQITSIYLSISGVRTTSSQSTQSILHSSPPPSGESGATVSAGAIAGIAIGTIVASIIVLGFVVTRQSTRSKPQPAAMVLVEASVDRDRIMLDPTAQTQVLSGFNDDVPGTPASNLVGQSVKAPAKLGQ